MSNLFDSSIDRMHMSIVITNGIEHEICLKQPTFPNDCPFVYYRNESYISYYFLYFVNYYFTFYWGIDRQTNLKGLYL